MLSAFIISQYVSSSTSLKPGGKKSISALAEFKRAHGHCNVAADWPENPKLAKWVNSKRNEMKKDKLDKERLEQLQKLRFVWRRREDAREEMYTELLQVYR